MLILVTGISGRIGANLAQALLEAGHTVRGLVWARDMRPGKLAQLDVELVEGTLVNPADVQRAVAGVDAICHLGAAFQGGGPFSHDDYFEINVRGTYNMLEAARLYAPGLQHFFFASTDAIYHKYVPGGMVHPIQEDTMEIAPAGWYAMSKVLGEQLCRDYQRNFALPITIFRFALAVAGDEILDFSQFRLSHWRKVYAERAGAAAAEVRRQLQAAGDGQEKLVIARDGQGRSYKKQIADVRDIVLGFQAALGKPAAIGETFQLAAPTPFTWAETVPYLAEKLGLAYVEIQFPDQIPTFYEFDMSKGRRLIGYTPQYDMRRMIEAALAFRQGTAQDVIPV